MLKKEQREIMRQLVRDVVVDSIDEANIRRWAELARWEIWKGRHDTTLREFLSDFPKAKLFLAGFIMKLADVRVLRAEFIPLSIRASLSGYDFKGALSRLPGDAHAETAPSQMLPAPALPPPDHHLNVAEPPAPVTITAPTSANLTESRISANKEEVVSLLSTWFVNEGEPGYYRDVANEIEYQICRFSQNHLTAATSANPKDVIDQCRPADERSSSCELVAYLAGWAANWLLALNSDPRIAHAVVGSGFSQLRLT